ncbi:MAG: NADH-quinone oxidoreductase subunit NuoF [Dehalococcoidales bacterium]|nr:NADH-quinone oxidoreductase subunit NuoF [Dehalococcoidales bacterium]
MITADFRAKAEKEWQKITNPSIPQIFIGMATCGEAAGALSIYKSIESTLMKNHIEARIHKTGCLGMCYCEPMVDIIKPGQPRITYRNLEPETAAELITDYLVNNNYRTDLALGAWGEAIDGIPNLFEIDFLKYQERTALKNIGVINPEDISQYIARGGYKGFEKALCTQQDEIIDEVEKSGLRGLGGAGFPTGFKWKECRKTESYPKYLICNADEGDPGAYMDRSLLESDPHSVLEGMLIAAYAIGCSRGFIYIRDEYPLAIKRVRTAIEQMGQYELLGENILDSGFNFDIEIREGAGAFVCGEESALLASIEGNRGMPRHRPPYPAESGLWGKPTDINNVKTLANIPAIITNGAEWFADRGTGSSKGTAIFALTGKVANRGLIEVPMGITLRKIIFDIGGGIPNGKEFKAVQTGGPSGGCLPAELLELPIAFDSLAVAGSIMGSGGMVVLDEDTCMVDVARFFLDFAKQESCGQCIPCRLGTKQMFDILDDITKGKGRQTDIDMLLELSESVAHTSLCGLGRTAPNPVLTTLRYFQNEYEAHINHKRCHANVCRLLVEEGNIDE